MAQLSQASSQRQRNSFHEAPTHKLHDARAQPHQAHTPCCITHTHLPQRISLGVTPHTLRLSPFRTVPYVVTPGDTTHTASVYWHPPENTPVPARNASKAAHRSCDGSKAALSCMPGRQVPKHRNAYPGCLTHMRMEVPQAAGCHHWRTCTARTHQTPGRRPHHGLSDHMHHARAGTCA